MEKCPLHLAINKQINQWLLAYACKQSWTAYLQHGDVDSFVDRDLTQGILTSVDPDDNKSEFETRLLILLCKIHDGLDHTIRYGEDPEETTPLEGVLSHLELIRVDWDDHLTDPEDLVIVVKRQSVYVCCREGDFEEAQAVIDRLVPHMKNKAEKELLKTMLRVVKSHDVGHEELQLHPYTELHKAVVHTMSSLIHELDTPFIVKAAKAVIETKEAVSENGVENEHSVKPLRKTTNKHSVEPLRKTTNTGLTLDVSLSRLHQGSPQTKYLHNYRSEKLQQKCTKLKANRDEYIRRMPKELQVHVNGHMNDSHRKNDSSPVRRTSPIKRKRCIYDPSVSEDQTSESESEESSHPRERRTSRHDESLKSRLGVADMPAISRRDSLAPDKSARVRNRVQGVRKRTKWMPEEEEMLYRGVFTYGVGNWIQIETGGSFVNRSNMQLKDKWRTLNQPKFRKRMCELRDLIGKIPNVKY